MASEPYAEPTIPGAVAGSGTDESIEGRSPWYLAWRRLRRNKTAMAFGVLFLVIAACCLAAPIWANDFAHIGPNDERLNGSIVIDGHKTPIVGTVPGQLGNTPLGPGLHEQYLLGADQPRAVGRQHVEHASRQPGNRSIRDPIQLEVLESLA